MMNSFTKSGPGRMHDYSGVAKKCKKNEFFKALYIRRKAGAITDTFFKKWKFMFKREY